MQYVSPQQVGQRADVGEVGADIGSDEHGEHRSRTTPSHKRHQQQDGGQIVHQIAQHGGKCRQRQQRREAVAGWQEIPFAELNPFTIADRTTTESASTKARNGRLTARTMPPSAPRRRTIPRTASTAAPAHAAHAGERPTSDVTAKPASVSASTTSANTGSWGVAGTASSASVDNSPAKNHRKTTYSAAIASSHGAAISAVKRVNDSPALANASRFVKFDTGSNSEAVLAR